MKSRATARHLPLLPRLRRGALLAVAIKLLVLVALYWLFFSPSQRPQVDEHTTARHFLVTG